MESGGDPTVVDQRGTPRRRGRGSRGRGRAGASEASTAEAGGTAVPELDTPADVASPAVEGATPEVAPAEAGAERKEPAQRRSAAGSKAASPISVNVAVPRGLGRRVNSRLIERVVKLALERDGWSRPASLDVVMVSDDEMREINATRRGVDEATDVLSFPLVELRPGEGVAEDFFVLPPEQQLHLGDVVISFSRVESQADEAGHSRERELAFLTVHAVLHILGYDHDTESGRRQMRRREEDVLAELGLRRDGS